MQQSVAADEAKLQATSLFLKRALPRWTVNRMLLFGTKINPIAHMEQPPSSPDPGGKFGTG